MRNRVQRPYKTVYNSCSWLDRRLQITMRDKKQAGRDWESKRHTSALLGSSKSLWTTHSASITCCAVKRYIHYDSAQIQIRRSNSYTAILRHKGRAKTAKGPKEHPAWFLPWQPSSQSDWSPLHKKLRSQNRIFRLSRPHRHPQQLIIHIMYDGETISDSMDQSLYLREHS